MSMIDPWTWLWAGLAGAGLGAFFFSSLWWTVQQTVGAERSMLWHFGGLLLRMAVTLLGFYAVGAGQWQRLVACLIGFVVARMVVLRLCRHWPRTPANPGAEVPHAPQP